MNKEELQKIAEELYWGAFYANAYYLIMMQYNKLSKEYNNEINLSPAFYQIVYDALQNACIMELAKLYEKSNKVFSIGVLIKECQESVSLFSEYRATIKEEFEGQEYIFQIPYQHELKPEEECFFKDQVEKQRKILRLFDVSPTENSPVRVDLTFSEYLDLYYKRFCALSKKQENLRVQRNKIYAHNDMNKLSCIDEILKKHPIYYADIQELIDFALDTTKLIIVCLTGVNKANKCVNINDWEHSLKMAKLGLKYQEFDCK